MLAARQTLLLLLSTSHWLQPGEQMIGWPVWATLTAPEEVGGEMQALLLRMKLVEHSRQPVESQLAQLSEHFVQALPFGK